MKVAVVSWFGMSIVGSAVLAAPDNDDRVLALSRQHGMSLSDAVVSVVLLIGRTMFVTGLVRKRRRVARPMRSSLLAAGGTAVIVWSVARDHGAWWVLGAGVAVLAQLDAGLQMIATTRAHEERSIEQTEGSIDSREPRFPPS